MNIRRSPLSMINITSLVDVTMVLLIVFIITAPALHEWIEVSLPKAEASRADLKEGLVVSITKSGDVYLDRRRVAMREFDAKFEEAWDRSGRRAVFLRADREVVYGTVMDVVGRIRALGGEDLGLVVESEPKK